MKRIDLFKDALAITMGYEVGKFLLKVSGNVFVKLSDAWMIKMANEGREPAKEFCKKWNLKYNEWDKSINNDLDNLEVFFHNREEAEKLMEDVIEGINTFGVFTVSDLRMALGLHYKEYQGYPGWTNPDCCTILKEKNLYILHFEPVEYIERKPKEGKKDGEG